MSATSTPLGNASRPRKPSFIELFLGTDPSITRSNRGMKMVRPRKTSTPVSSTEAKVVTTAVPTPAVTTPAPPAETPAPPASVPAPAPVPVPVAIPVPALGPAAETIPAAKSNGWTGIDDTLIIGMKAQGKTWKEIHDALPMKSKDDLKQRFKELSNDGKGKDKDEVVLPARGNGKNKKNGKKQVFKAVVDDSDRADDEGIDPRGPFTSDFKSFKKGKKSKSFKIIEVDSDEEEPADLRGHPIVYMDPDEGLTEVHMKMLYKLTRKNDEVKWLEIASRFYDKTGKRMEPEVLKHMLRNL